MKTNHILFSFLLSTFYFLLFPSAQAGSRSSANYAISADSVDAGGRRTSSALYANDASLGGLGGAATASPSYRAKAGFDGQLFEVLTLSLSANPTNVNEATARQLMATATLDDGTVSVLAPGTVTWSVLSGPINSINASGLATAANVYQNTPAIVRGNYFSKSSTLGLMVLNVGNDDFGPYASDGIDDAWQVQYFGLNNLNAAPGADPDGDGQNNLFEYLAGTDPTDQNSHFNLTIANGSSSIQKVLAFSPRLDNRSYFLEFKTNLLSGSFAPLLSSTQTDVGSTRMVTDTNAVDASRFYRVRISLP